MNPEPRISLFGILATQRGTSEEEWATPPKPKIINWPDATLQPLTSLIYDFDPGSVNRLVAFGDLFDEKRHHRPGFGVECGLS